MHMLTYRVLCQVMELRSQMLVSAGSLKRDEGALLLDHIESILRHQRQLQDSTQQVMAAELGICVAAASSFEAVRLTSATE